MKAIGRMAQKKHEQIGSVKELAMACKLSGRIVNQITKLEGSPTATPVKESRAEMAQNDTHG
jgi:hypothetical protein